jgi:tRNA uridine 5-carboxymethylaminomethyl modification enzyme
MTPREQNSLMSLIHYDGYLDKQATEVSRFRQLENLRIPEDFDFDAVNGLSNECRLRLQQVQPGSLGQASRLSGITPAAITCLMLHLRQS